MVSTRNMHIDEELLERYALKQLSENEAAPLEEHLLICQDCQERLVETEQFVYAVKEALPQLQPAPAVAPWRRWFATPKVLWVPALGMAVAVLMVVQMQKDDLSYQQVELSAMRAATYATAEAGRGLDLKLTDVSLKSGQPYRVQIVDSRGTNLWFGAVIWKEGKPTVNVPRALTAGNYWVRIFGAAADAPQISEYRLQVR